MTAAATESSSWITVDAVEWYPLCPPLVEISLSLSRGRGGVSALGINFLGCVFSMEDEWKPTLLSLESLQRRIQRVESHGSCRLVDKSALEVVSLNAHCRVDHCAALDWRGRVTVDADSELVVAGARGCSPSYRALSLIPLLSQLETLFFSHGVAVVTRHGFDLERLIYESDFLSAANVCSRARESVGRAC